MTDALGMLLSKLENVRRSGDGFAASCPSHEDHQPSLAITQASDRILIHCHAGCTPEAVTNSLGMELRELFISSAGTRSNSMHARRLAREIVGVYPYVDESGFCLFETVRYVPKDFRQRVPDGAGGHQYSLKGVRRVLYRLPSVLEQSRANGRVFIVEGEKDADALYKLGLVATTSPMGAGKWRNEYAAFLKGAQIAIIPDNDLAGEAHAQVIAKSLRAHAQDVRIVRLPGIPEKGDVSDWISNGGTREQLVALVESADLVGYGTAVATPRALVRCFSDIERKEPHWMWPKWLVFGQLNQLIGDPEVGKSMIALSLCAAISKGASFPDGQPNPWGPQNVLIMAAEDDIESVVKPRLQAAVADESRIFYLDGTLTASGEERVGIRLFADHDAIRQTIIEKEIAFLYIDALSDTLSSAQTDPNNELKVREALSIPKGIAEETKCCVLFTRHKSKAGGRSAVLGGLGSVGYSAVVRSSLDAVVDPNDPSRRILTRNKSNLAAPVSSLVYTIEDSAGIGPRIVWKGTDPRSAQDLLFESESRLVVGGELVRAKQFLESLLTDGPKSSVKVRDAAEDEGISMPTLQRAAKALGIRQTRSGKGSAHSSTWSMPHLLPASNSAEISTGLSAVTNLTTSSSDSIQKAVGAEPSSPMYPCNKCHRRFFDCSPLNPDGFGCKFCIAEELLR